MQMHNGTFEFCYMRSVAKSRKGSIASLARRKIVVHDDRTTNTASFAARLGQSQKMRLVVLELRNGVAYVIKRTMARIFCETTRHFRRPTLTQFLQ